MQTSTLNNLLNKLNKKVKIKLFDLVYCPVPIVNPRQLSFKQLISCDKYEDVQSKAFNIINEADDINFQTGNKIE